MNNRRTVSFSILAAALLALALPSMAMAQGNRYPDYNRNEERYLRDSIHRLDRLSKDFERDLDRALDRSRRDGTRREDQMNMLAQRFRDSVGDLKSRFGNGRDLYRSRNEAARVLQLGDQLERNTRPRWFDSRLSSELNQIRRELNVIERAYGLHGYDRNGRNGGWGRGNGAPWWQQLPFPR
jgi:hypothetical protein